MGLGNLLVVLMLECSQSMIDCGVRHIHFDGVGQGRGGWMLGVEELLKGNCRLIESLRGDVMGQRWVGKWRRIEKELDSMGKRMMPSICQSCLPLFSG